MRQTVPKSHGEHGFGAAVQRSLRLHPYTVPAHLSGRSHQEQKRAPESVVKAAERKKTSMQTSKSQTITQNELASAQKVAANKADILKDRRMDALRAKLKANNH